MMARKIIMMAVVLAAAILALVAVPRVIVPVVAVWALVKVIQRLNMGQAALRALEIVMWVVGGGIGVVVVVHNPKPVLEVVAMIAVAGLLMWVIDRLHAWRVVGFWTAAALMVFMSWELVESIRHLNLVLAGLALAMLVVSGAAVDELRRR